VTRLFDNALIRDLEAEWRRQGVDFLDALAPGLSDPEIYRIAEPLGYKLPEEARRWYRWCNGSDLYNVVFPRYITSLQESVETTIDFASIIGDDWKTGWLRTMSERPDLVFDCRGPSAAPVPVWHYDPEFDYPTRPVFPSIGEMVAFWIDLMRRNLMVWNPKQGWTVPDAFPDDLRERLLGVPSD
jgi:hypothetical protein